MEIPSEIGVVDHVISDPPYEDELHAAIGRIKRTDGRDKDFGFEGSTPGGRYCSAVVEAASGWAALFCLAEGVRHGEMIFKLPGRNGTPRLHGLSPTPPLDQWPESGAVGVHDHLLVRAGTS